VSTADPQWSIVGQGLAGTCLAWQLWQRSVSFTITDNHAGGSSRVAAGLINPVTGKNFEPSWRIGDFLPDALEFYRRVEARMSRQLWHPFPILRLAATDKEWQKIRSKLDSPGVTPWRAASVTPPPGWCGAVEVHGGGRLDTRAFIEGSREFFENLGCYHRGEIDFNHRKAHQIWCLGASGLIAGHLGTHRCAKGEILTIHAPTWDDSQIRIGAGGWLVPIGKGNFKVGSTYEWNQLDQQPTEYGRLRVTEIASKLGGDSFQILDHDAAIRPILRRSQPLIGVFEANVWIFNALGSKGSLYAPGIADRLANWMLKGIQPEADINFNTYLEESKNDTF
jgi:glycine/D-amino acid oxidase-like deaminating enzyme